MILIEKPLVDKFLSTREKNEKFFKRSLMVSLVKPTPVNRSRREPISARPLHPPPQSTITPTDDRKLERQNPVDYNLLANLDTFGLSSSSAAAISNVFTKEETSPPKSGDKPPVVPVLIPMTAAASTTTPVSLKRSRDPSPAASDREDESLSNQKAVTKKSKSARSSDNESYSDYDDEDENEKLMIVDPEATSEKIEKLPAEEKFQTIETIDDEPKSPANEENNMITETVKAKIIPLENELPKTSKVRFESNKIKKKTYLLNLINFLGRNVRVVEEKQQT